MRINVQKYEYQKLNGVLTKVELPKRFLYRIISDFYLFIFKMLNHKHVYNKDEYGRNYIQQIIEIRGLRKCVYAGIGGQRATVIFCRKIEKVC